MGWITYKLLDSPLEQGAIFVKKQVTANNTALYCSYQDIKNARD